MTCMYFSIFLADGKFAGCIKYTDMYRWNAFIHCSSDKFEPFTFAVDTRKVGASLSPPTEREYSCWA